MSFKTKKEFFKLMNNCIYDKTINARLISNAKKYMPYKNEFLG